LTWQRCSSALKLNFSYLLDRIWAYLSLLRIYTKKKGGAYDCMTSCSDTHGTITLDAPDFSTALILRGNGTVRDACNALHRTLADHTRSALVWGVSTKHDPQRVGLMHELADEDVVQITKK